MNKIKNFKEYFIYSGISKDDYKFISGEIQSGNRQNLIIFSAVASVFLFIMFFLSFFSKDVETSRWVYFFTMLSTLSVLVTAKLFSENSPLILLTDIYIFVSILFIFGIILGTVTRPDEQTVSFIALILTVPLLFTDKPVRMAVFINFYTAVFIIIALYVKVDYVLTADIIDACVFGAISVIVSTYMMNVKCQRYLYEQKVSVMSEIDLLTGIRNRNCYEKNLSFYPSLCSKSVSCVFIDVNGLHELNNTKGHEAGDKMLKFVAGKLQEYFGKNDSYRIGGDEFVAFAVDCTPEELKRRTESLIKDVEEMNYHISVGCDTGLYSGINIDSIIKNAEKHMYEDKTLFYQQKGIDRRVRI
ncbi:MAG: GGDEF domain-containing protein [Ruminococcus sp.]